MLCASLCVYLYCHHNIAVYNAMSVDTPETHVTYIYSLKSFLIYIYIYIYMRLCVCVYGLFSCMVHLCVLLYNRYAEEICCQSHSSAQVTAFTISAPSNPKYGQMYTHIQKAWLQYFSLSLSGFISFFPLSPRASFVT